MKKFIVPICLLFFISIIISCQKSAPNTPQAPGNTATITLTSTITASISPTFTVTPTNTNVVDILVEDFEDTSLLINYVDYPNNIWQFTNDLPSGGGSTWDTWGYCAAIGYSEYGLQSLSVTGTVKAQIGFPGSYSGYLNARTTTMINGHGIDITQYDNVYFSAFSDAAPASGNMQYKLRLYNTTGQFISYGPNIRDEWSGFQIGLTYFSVDGASTAAEVLSDLAVIEIKVQYYSPNLNDTVPVNLCVDFIIIQLP